MCCSSSCYVLFVQTLDELKLSFPGVPVEVTRIDTSDSDLSEIHIPKTVTHVVFSSGVLGASTMMNSMADLPLGFIADEHASFRVRKSIHALFYVSYGAR